MNSMNGLVKIVGWAAFLCFFMIAADPALFSPRCRLSRKSHSANNLRQIGLGLLGYNCQNAMLPALTELKGQGRPLHSWTTRILPYLDNQDLYNQIDLTRTWDDPVNAAPLSQTLGILDNPQEPRDPVAPGLAPGHYAGNVRILGSPTIRKASSIPDGAATTFLAGEAFGNFRAWGDPGNNRNTHLGISKSPDGFGGHWPVPGANFLFADGSVRFLNADIDPRIFRALGTPDAGDRIPGEF